MLPSPISDGWLSSQRRIFAFEISISLLGTWWILCPPRRRRACCSVPHTTTDAKINHRLFLKCDGRKLRKSWCLHSVMVTLKYVLQLRRPLEIRNSRSCLRIDYVEFHVELWWIHLIISGLLLRLASERTQPSHKKRTNTSKKNHPTHTCAQSDVVRLLVGKFDVAPRRKNWIANQPTPFAIDWIERRLQLFGYPSKELNLFSTFP